jgi:hypothetical protein
MLLLSRGVKESMPVTAVLGWFAAQALGIAVVATGESWALSPTELSDARTGMTCEYYLATTRFAWGRKGGDWVDAEGVPYGAAAFATTTVSGTREGGQKVEWDVTRLARSWAGGAEPAGALFVRALERGSAADFHSRESASIGARPALIIDWADGTQTTAGPTADATILCTSVSGKGDKADLQAGHGKAIALVFPFAPKTGAQVKKATLVLTTESHYGRAVQLGIYHLRPPSALEMKPVMGLASGYPGDKGIEKSPDVIFATGFESSDWEDEWSSLSRSSNAETVDASEGNAFKPLQGKALRATVPKDHKQALNMLYKFAEKAGGEPDEAYFRYYLRLGENWQPLVGGKLPGFSGTYNKAGWGGRMSDGSNGWSARGRYVTHRGNGEPTPIGSYVYHAGMSKKYGSGWGWNLGETGLLQQNRWYSVEQYVRLNTPGRADGVLKAWVDGKLVFEKTDIRFRNVPELRIESLWMNVYHGGTKAANQDISLYIDNVVVAKKYIGPMAGAPRS